MPKATPPRTSPWALGIIAVPLLGVLAYALCQDPVWTILAVCAITLWARRETQRMRDHIRRIAAERPSEGICQFARSFDKRRVDTWIIRAVYEELQNEIHGMHPNLPIRSVDRFTEDLKIDPDDLDMAIAQRIAERTGRALKHTHANPYYGKVLTAADLVHFFNAQPLMDFRIGL